MRQMTSGISTNPQRLARAVTDTVKRSQKQQVQLAAPDVAMVGVPGEPDYKKGVTDAFQQMMPVHKNSGNGVVGGVSYRTNELAWRDYSPGFFQGLFAPEGEYNAKPFYYTDIQAAMDNPDDPALIKTAAADELPVYGEAATPTRSQARPGSTQVIQDSDVW